MISKYCGSCHYECICNPYTITSSDKVTLDFPPLNENPKISISYTLKAGEHQPGYHEAYIVKGELGQSSKIQEELDELKDAESQKCTIMALLELSDLYGSIETYLTKHFPDFTMEDLKKMSEITKRAFQSGERK